MSARTTAELVAKVIEVDSSIDLTPFISVANILVTEHCAYDDTEKMTQIETWLAAHFYGIRDKQSGSEGVAGISVSYQTAIGRGLAITHHGQMAMLLDTDGGLAALSKMTETGRSRKVSISYLGVVSPRAEVQES